MILDRPSCIVQTQLPTHNPNALVSTLFLEVHESNSQPQLCYEHKSVLRAVPLAEGLQ